MTTAQIPLWEPQALDQHHPPAPEQNAFVILDRQPGIRAIEDPAFPFEHLSAIAEAESWRKEVNRPLSHLHKWWAQRLGSVFRAILIGTFAPQGSDVLDLFYRPVRIPGATVFDPFMGSGTTVSEAMKLGARSIGRDINPVAYFLVRNALTFHNRAEVQRTFDELEGTVAHTLRRFYQATLPGGRTAETLYYFWVKQIDCPSCQQNIDLFTSYIFAKHAYPKRHPEAQATCSQCGEINEIRYDAEQFTCSHCHHECSPSQGPVNRQAVSCPHCQHTFPLVKAMRGRDGPLQHRMFAKLVLMESGEKRYLRADEHDQTLFEEARALLQEQELPYPLVRIEPGHNTDQVIRHNYHQWHEMFNDRQLLCLSLLGRQIGQIESPQMRDLFMCLFSGMLEFNNMFASYKGEGTGAVRHMFAHHVLKPERVPLEANIWGTPKSSGSFSTLFKSRLLRLLDYAEDPFELRVGGPTGKTEKVFGLSEALGAHVAGTYAELGGDSRLYLSCGDSSTTDIPTGSVDAVITDPPFFDNVHYSQLADFFHVWQRHLMGEQGVHTLHSTRSDGEVQDSDAASFVRKLTSVFAEAHRVLHDQGVLVFSYHHSRPEGWNSMLEAVMQSGFRISAALPIKSELSASVPKQQTKEPIDLDIILVCRKCEGRETSPEGPNWSEISAAAEGQVLRLRQVDRKLSKTDVRIIVTAQLIKTLSTYPVDSAQRLLSSSNIELENLIRKLSL